jgi:hypothetical protein
MQAVISNRKRRLKFFRSFRGAAGNFRGYVIPVGKIGNKIQKEI